MLAAKQSGGSVGILVIPIAADCSIHERTRQVLGIFNGSLMRLYLSRCNVRLCCRGKFCARYVEF